MAVPATVLEKTQSMQLQLILATLHEWPTEIRAGANRPQARKYYEFFAKWLEGKVKELKAEVNATSYEVIR